MKKNNYGKNSKLASQISRDWFFNGIRVNTVIEIYIIEIVLKLCFVILKSALLPYIGKVHERSKRHKTLNICPGKSEHGN